MDKDKEVNQKHVLELPLYCKQMEACHLVRIFLYFVFLNLHNFNNLVAFI